MKSTTELYAATEFGEDYPTLSGLDQFGRVSHVGKVIKANSHMGIARRFADEILLLIGIASDPPDDARFSPQDKAASVLRKFVFPCLMTEGHGHGSVPFYDEPYYAIVDACLAYLTDDPERCDPTHHAGRVRKFFRRTWLEDMRILISKSPFATQESFVRRRHVVAESLVHNNDYGEILEWRRVETIDPLFRQVVQGLEPSRRELPRRIKTLLKQVGPSWSEMLEIATYVSNEYYCGNPVGGNPVAARTLLTVIAHSFDWQYNCKEQNNVRTR